MAAVQRTLLGGERMAAVWLHDAQIQKHVSCTNCKAPILLCVCKCERVICEQNNQLRRYCHMHRL